MGLIRDYIDGAFKNESEGEVGIAGFTTVARVRDNISRTREVPTTYLEDGSHVNDHIIRNPIIISIEGNVSDVHVKPSPALEEIRDVETIVGEVAQYLPGRTQTQISLVAGITGDVQQQVDRIDSAVRTGQRVADFAGYTGPGSGTGPSKTNIEKFIDHMEGLLESDALIKIDGPARTYHNMCVTSFEYTLDNTSEAIGFSIEAQELRLAQTIFAEIAKNPASSTNGQHDGESNKGAQEGDEAEQSFISRQLERFGVTQ